MPQTHLETAAIFGQWRPVSMHPLKHDGGAVGKLLEHSSGVHDAARLVRSRTGGLGVEPGGKGLTILDQPEGGQSEAGRGDKKVDIVEREQIAETLPVI
jgi:hypothetical protein